ncbi:GntR family transcriptional regulator [Salinicola avicenniae]|uniref:GntR family transcriptional regulator n=1 Tax=Salinicola avicenniae TaxID=2916836 RepID=UPI002073DF5A|nr:MULTISPECIES: GntR family transcriptional regulator [unclassified Salinicola]
MEHRFSHVEPASLGGSVYTHLREALIGGQLKPDDRLRIRELAEQFGTSVTPVRDAILRLCKEQVLEMRTARDIRVPLIDVAQYDEIYRLRLELEGMAAALAAAAIDDAAARQLREQVGQNHRAIVEGDMARAMKLNQQFHFALAGLAGSPMLERFIDSLWMRAGPVIALAYRAFSERVAIQHHWEVLEALESRDAEAARLAIRRDIEDGYDMMVQFLTSLRQDRR